MINDFHLVMVVRNPKRTMLLRIPRHQGLQDQLKESWISDFELMVYELDQIDFRAGYNLKNHQCFRFMSFDLPSWISKHNSITVMSIPEIGRSLETYYSIQGTLAFTKNELGEELILFQNFSRSRVIDPGRFVHIQGETHRINEHHGILLDQKLSAVSLPQERKLLFRNFRAVNSYLPVFEFYRKASEREIRELLNHGILAAENPNTWATEANQWFRTRLLQLKDSGILDRYTAMELKNRSEGFNVPIQVVNDKLVLPSDRVSAKKILQFLNEEIFKGAVTNTLYESISKNPIVDSLPAKQ